MASLDTSQYSSSADVFTTFTTTHQIQAFHKQLRDQIHDKEVRLRTHVGNSYRELLGTADSIVRMRGDNDAVQDILGSMGGRCGRGIVSAKAKGLGSFIANEERGDAERNARLGLLEKCGLMAGRVLRNGGGLTRDATKGDRLLLASKVLVLMRLLIKQLADDETDDHTKEQLEEANKTYASLRGRLRRGVDKVIEKEDGDSERHDILKALSAHSLVSSSGAKDVLRYFLDVRAGAIALAFDAEELEREPNSDDIVRSLKLYTRSLLDVQAIVPTRLSQALSSLKQKPLLADSALKQLDGLRLDVYEGWCGEEIQYFTPFIRHNDLDGKQARDMLSGWGKKGGSVVLKGLAKTLEHMAEFKSIMELRTSVLQLWIRDGNRAKGFDPEEMQDELREAINERMLSVLETKVNKLHLVSSEVKATLESWQSGVTDKRARLWDEDGYEEALAQGAGPFIEEVMNRVYGRTDAVSKAGHCYNSWFHVIDDVKEVVSSLRKQRWDNDYDEIEDDETIEARQQVLSKEDPKMLQDKLDTTLEKAFRDLDKSLQELWKGQDTATVAMYMLRIIRDIRSRLPDRESLKPFGLAMVSPLQQRIVEDVSASSLEVFESKGLTQRTVISRPLWEGQPAVPTQPSPQVFMFLRDLSHAMGDAGTDIWTKAGVAAMKKHLDTQLSSLWKAASEELSSEQDKSDSKDEEKETTQGDEEDEEEVEEEEEEEEEEKAADKKNQDAQDTEQQKKDLRTQWLFDVAYLRSCIETAEPATDDKLKAVEDDLWKQSGLGDDAVRETLNKSAQNYWGRTSLLFGLLA